MKKALLSLALAAILVAMIAAPALANVTLPLEFTWVNNANQSGWRSSGTDNVETDLTIEQLKSATSLILEVSNEPVGDAFHLVFQSDPDWGWNQYEFNTADVYANGRIVLEFANHPNHADLLAAEEYGKLLIGYWGDGSMDISALGITRAYLTVGGGGEGPKTGDNTMIALALTVLTLAAGATVFLARKLKA
ncbi:MAG: LPXTG cell wall anchor domain-containing protein [Oscillospiraceae bacterium]|nr:LPXTG cell wall anchor domain-containing protein [Oscillospiraceae bacterium]